MSIIDDLKLAFGSNSAQYKTKSGAYLAKSDLGKIIAKYDLDATNQVIRGYNSLYRSNNLYNSDSISPYNIHYSREMLYDDYEQMDRDATMSAALNIYAEECITKNEFGNILTIESDDVDVVEELEYLFYDILRIDVNLFPWSRNLVKYGDSFLRLDIVDKLGITGAYSLSPYSIQRNESDSEVTFTYNQSMDSVSTSQVSKSEMLDNFEVIHFRLLTDTNFFPYGRGILENGRKSWKQLTLLEDAMLIYRIMRSPERRLFKIDVGNIKPDDVDSYMNEIIAQSKKSPYIDPATGDYDLRFNILNSLEDFYIPVRGSNNNTEIDTLSGLDNSTSIDDIEYIRDKTLSSLTIPRAFLTFDDSLNSKATLSSEDIRFSRAVERIQHVIVDGLTKLAMIHLYTRNFSDEQIASINLSLSTSSKLAELERIDILNSKLSLMRDLMDNNMFSRKWAYENIFTITEEGQAKLEIEMVEDSKLKYRLEQIERDGEDPFKSDDTSDDENDDENKSKSLSKQPMFSSRQIEETDRFIKQISSSKHRISQLNKLKNQFQKSKKIKRAATKLLT